MAVKNLLRIRSRLLVAIRRSLEKPRKQATAILQATAKSYAIPGDDSAWVKSATSQGHLDSNYATGRRAAVKQQKTAFTVDIGIIIGIGGVLMSYACMRSYWI